MTWSKITSYIFNLAISVILWNYLVESKVDAKLSGGLYAAYILIYMFISDLLTKMDKGSSISKANEEISSHTKKIKKYEKCMLQVHDSIIVCMRDNQKGATLKHSLSAMTMQLTAITIDAVNDPSTSKSVAIDSVMKTEMDEVDIFIAGQSRD